MAFSTPIGKKGNNAGVKSPKSSLPQAYSYCHRHNSYLVSDSCLKTAFPTLSATFENCIAHSSITQGHINQ